MNMLNRAALSLASDGSVLSSSAESQDIFKYQRSYQNGPVYALLPVISLHPYRADRGLSFA